MPPDPPREQDPPGLATPTQINATPTSKTVENPETTNNQFFLNNFQDFFHGLGKAIQIFCLQFHV